MKVDRWFVKSECLFSEGSGSIHNGSEKVEKLVELPLQAVLITLSHDGKTCIIARPLGQERRLGFRLTFSQAVSIKILTSYI